MRAGRLWCLSASVLVLWIATPVLAAENPPQPSLPVDFDQTVYGDVTVIGNAVLGCPPDDDTHDPQFPARLCREAQSRRGSGVSAQNNGHWMTWTDVDGDPATYNSSTATLDVPAGASVAYAKLGWAGATARSSTAPCGRRGERPPGEPALQAPVLAVGGKTTALGPRRFTYTVDHADALGPTDQQFYSAQADVTAEFRAVATGRPVPVTVGNIWTPQGRDCFGGWALTLVWSFDRAHQEAPARRHITVHSGHVRVQSQQRQVQARLAGVRPTGGRARIGVTAYEGDWAQPADRLLVNGQAQADPGGGGTDNFFSSYALGNPEPVNNLSVDAKVVEVAAAALPPADPDALLDLSGRTDAFLVQGAAVSVPLPELVVTIRPDRPAVHAGDPVDHTVEVTNTGEAPARDLAARIAGGPACARLPDELAGGASAAVACRTEAAADDHPVTVEVGGSSLAGDRLAGTATTSVEVLRPAIGVVQTVEPDVVVDGQTVTVDVRVENTGDTPLSGLRLDHDVLEACDRADAGTVDPGQAVTVTCEVEAGVTDVADTVTVTGSDRLGLATTASATAGFSVVNPLLTLSAVWSADAVRAGETVAITVRVGNPGRIAFDDVAVEGEPAECRRMIGELPAGATVTYTCEVVVERDLRTDLTVVGTPRLAGADAAKYRRSASAPVRVTVLAPELEAPVPPPPTPPEQVRPEQVPPEQVTPGQVPPEPAPENPVTPAPTYPVAHSQPAAKPVIALIAVAAGMAIMVVTAAGMAAARKG
ncbi:hypothetical protein ABZ816_34190 [Actinosynnema sp. NPDC047251]|uniref:Secreted protein n=1 Tax=Saccharothrix espanaensis (strain ATCC 51144 / DSM 44229 / JCM 9112 / NBRC 15066 / NRRL 15764) TaxID=1179773 RepID=K0JWM5_SACES|nr:hypothetical protein [Saccharothrix espanaensis]CCH32250.1 hypothetical protein BN6_49810 [Saccharothrix espanaensis DSM 44229]